MGEQYFGSQARGGDTGVIKELLALKQGSLQVQTGWGSLSPSFW